MTMKLNDAVKEYLDYLQSVARRSPFTITAYRYDLARFTTFLGDGTGELAEIDPPLVERWMASMRHLSDATVTRALNSLSALFKWAIRFRYAQANPLDLVQRPRKRRRIAPCPKPEEVQAMLDATRGVTQRAALLTLATSGLRRAELLGLTWSCVDLLNRRLRIHGKGDKQREVLIFDDLLPVLYALHAEQGFPTSAPVFRGRLGRPLQQSSLQAWLNKWLEGAGLRSPDAPTRRNRYSLHSLRRFAAKRWLESGLNIRQIQMLLGHEDLQTTILYLNYDLDEIQRAAHGVTFRIKTSQ
jgi:integrase/recombinase XerC